MNPYPRTIIEEASGIKMEVSNSDYRIFEEGREMGIKEAVEWLKQYAIHGGSISLHIVLKDMETHSPFMSMPSSRNGA